MSIFASNKKYSACLNYTLCQPGTTTKLIRQIIPGDNDYIPRKINKKPAKGYLNITLIQD
ncbi:hypothetical protein SynA1562_01750 [Synechococcus sp. A15-62]|nr:hypothetical protein SynA1562_01750 [Synechococcus sp. A15-62]